MVAAEEDEAGSRRVARWELGSAVVGKALATLAGAQRVASWCRQAQHLHTPLDRMQRGVRHGLV